MTILLSLYKTILDALFPISGAETELFSYSPEEVSLKLPAAPYFSGLAVSTDDAKLMSSIFAYKDERVAKMIWNIKYKKSVLANSMGAYALWRKLQVDTVEQILQDTPSTSVDSIANSPASLGPKRPSESLTLPTRIIIPMPITLRRRKERGYNQCEMLVDEIAYLDGGQHFIMVKDMLIRTQHLERQTLKRRADRLLSAKGIFSLDPEEVGLLNKRISELSHKRATALIAETQAASLQELYKKVQIVIIDDVITTGSTMKEAIDTLKNAGFENVKGLSLAH